MELSVSRQDATIDVAIAGELDLASGRRLDAALRTALAEGAERVHLDLSACTFIDSAGLGLLLSWREELEAGGRDFGVSGAQGAVKRVFHLTGLEL